MHLKWRTGERGREHIVERILEFRSSQLCFQFSGKGGGGKRVEEGGAMGNFCLRCFSGLRLRPKFPFTPPSNPSMTKMPARKVRFSLSLPTTNLAEIKIYINQLFLCITLFMKHHISACYPCESMITGKLLF